MYTVHIFAFDFDNKKFIPFLPSFRNFLAVNHAPFSRYQYTSSKYCKWLFDLVKAGKVDMKDDSLPKGYSDYLDQALKDAKDAEDVLDFEI